MADVLTLLTSNHADLLTPGEQFLVAAKTERRLSALRFSNGMGMRHAAPGVLDHPPGLRLTDAMVWGVSAQRLFMWTTRYGLTSQPKQLLATLLLGSEVREPLLTDSPHAGYGKLYLRVTMLGAPVEVAVRRAEAEQMTYLIASAPPPL